MGVLGPVFDLRDQAADQADRALRDLICHHLLTNASLSHEEFCAAVAKLHMAYWRGFLEEIGEAGPQEELWWRLAGGDGLAPWLDERLIERALRLGRRDGDRHLTAEQHLGR